MNELINLGNNIKAERIKKKIPISIMASKVNSTKKDIEALESGKAVPLILFLKVAKALNVKPSVLISLISVVLIIFMFI